MMTQNSESTFAQVVEQGVRAYQAVHELKLIGMTVAYIAEAAAIGPSTLDTWRSQTMRRVPRDYRVLASFAKVVIEAVPELGEEWVRSLFLTAGMAGYCDPVIAEIFGQESMHSVKTGKPSAMREPKARWAGTSSTSEKREALAQTGIVPHLPNHYVSRTAYLEELKGRIRGLHQTGGCVGVIGMTGIGKTTLMAAIGHDPEIRALFADRVHWLELRPGEGGFEMQQHIAQSLVSSVAEPFGADQGMAEVSRSRVSGRSVLLLVDDVKTVEQAEVLKSLPPGVVTVFTTRRSNVSATLNLSGQNLILLDKMTEAEAGMLINNISPGCGEQRDAAERLARLADYHPHALAAISFTARTLEITWADAEAAFHSASARSMLLRPHSAGHQGIWATLEADWQELDWRCRDALQTLASLPESTFLDVSLAQEVWKVDSLTATLMLKVLVALNLVSLTDAHGSRCTMHWVIRDFVRQKTAGNAG